MKTYWIHWPGLIYAFTLEAKNKKEVRAYFREWIGKKRLPNQTAIWIKTS